MHRDADAVSVTDDNTEDDGETCTVTLSNASGAKLADAAATGAIRNMEAATPTKHAGIRAADEQRDGAGGRDADGVGIGHLRRRPAG